MEQRKVYYDHEPSYKRLKEKGKTGWTTAGHTGPWRLYLEFFRETGHLPPKGSPVLDLGCGGGEFALMLAAEGYKVTGLEYSATAIKMARANAVRQKVNDVRFIQGDALAPGLSKETFAALFANNVLHCIIGADRSRFWKSIHDLLQPGASALVSCMVGTPRGKAFDDFNPRTRIIGDNTRYIATRAEVLREVRNAGLRPAVVAYTWNYLTDKDSDCDDLWVVALKSK